MEFTLYLKFNLLVKLDFSIEFHQKLIFASLVLCVLILRYVQLFPNKNLIKLGPASPFHPCAILLFFSVFWLTRHISFVSMKVCFTNFNLIHYEALPKFANKKAKNVI